MTGCGTSSTVAIIGIVRTPLEYASMSMDPSSKLIESISSSSANLRFDDTFHDEYYRTLGAQDEPQPSTNAADVVEATESSSDSAKLPEGLDSLRISVQTATVRVGISDSALKSDPGLDTSRALCTWPGCPETFIRFSDRDRHYQTIHANNGDRPHKCLVEGCSANVKSWTRIEKLRTHNKNWHGPYHCPEKGCSRGFPCGFGSQLSLDEHILEAHPDSANSTSVKGKKPELNAYGFPLAECSPPGLPFPPQPPIYEPMHKAYNQDKSPRMIGRIFSEDPKSSVHRVDPNFRVHKSKEFRFGRIFKVLWSEPSGSGGTDISSDDDMPMTKARAHTKTRRFVIVGDEKKGHSICLPILTYGLQGTLKRGVHAEDHAQIYTPQKGKKGPPPLLPGEQLSKRAIRMDPISALHKLHPLSRINYAKLYTVEHNVKVYFIGWVAMNYQQRVVVDYNNTHRPLPDRPHLSSEDEEAHPPESGEDLKPSHLQPDHNFFVREDHEASTATGLSSTPENPNQSSCDPQSIEDPEHNTPDGADNIPNIYDVDC